MCLYRLSFARLPMLTALTVGWDEVCHCRRVVVEVGRVLVGGASCPASRDLEDVAMEII